MEIWKMDCGLAVIFYTVHEIGCADGRSFGFAVADEINVRDDGLIGGGEAIGEILSFDLDTAIARLRSTPNKSPKLRPYQFEAN